MREYELYLPTTTNDGRRIDPAVIQRIKDTLAEIFGGYTHLDQRVEGAWRIGGVTLHDAVTIVRVLDDGTTAFDMAAFKRLLEATLEQQQVLIVARTVDTV